MICEEGRLSVRRVGVCQGQKGFLTKVNQDQDEHFAMCSEKAELA